MSYFARITREAVNNLSAPALKLLALLLLESDLKTGEVRRGFCSVSVIAENLKTSGRTVSRTLAQLCEQGYAAVIPVPGKESRIKVFRTTDKPVSTTHDKKISTPRRKRPDPKTKLASRVRESVESSSESSQRGQDETKKTGKDNPVFSEIQGAFFDAAKKAGFKNLNLMELEFTSGQNAHDFVEITKADPANLERVFSEIGDLPEAMRPRTAHFWLRMIRERLANRSRNTRLAEVDNDARAYRPPGPPPVSKDCREVWGEFLGTIKSYGPVLPFETFERLGATRTGDAWTVLIPDGVDPQFIEEDLGRHFDMTLAPLAGVRNILFKVVK